MCKKEKRTKDHSNFTQKGEKVAVHKYTVSPREAEQYWLRSPLLHKRVTGSFPDIKTVDGRDHPIYCKTCLHCGHLLEIIECKSLLRDEFESLRQLSRLFFAILQVHYKPSDAKQKIQYFNDASIADKWNRLRLQPLLAVAHKEL